MEANTTLDVLLVEDNPGDATLIQRNLAAATIPEVGSVTVEHTESLAAALAATDDHQFDAVLLDLGLPESTGLATLDRFLADGPPLPVVVLTGLKDEEASVEAIRRGAQDYLVKGDLGPDLLGRTLRYAIERKKHERTLTRRTGQLEFFHSILRHDVRNAMNVIQMNAELLQRNAAAEHQAQAESILEWTDNVADLTARVQRVMASLSGEAGPELDEVAIDSLISGEASRVRGMKRGVSIDVDLPAVSVTANDLLADVVGNVLTNAVEHHDGDSPSLAVTAEVTPNWVDLRIADDGPGIADARKEAVFDRGESSGTGKGGFGLFFVEAMVDAYGGEVWVEDRQPEGPLDDSRLDGGDGPDVPGTVVVLRLPRARD
jgi:signal transduction histidine kinase